MNLNIKVKNYGKIICDILLEAIENLDSNLKCYEAIEFLNDYIIRYYKEHNIFNVIKDDAANQPAASVIMYSKKYNQIWLIGDCKALYGNSLIDNELEVDKLYTQIRVMIIKYLIETGVSENELLTDDIACKFVSNLARRQPYIRNKVYNSMYDYVAIDGFNKPSENLVKCIDVPNEVKEIVFASDGYMKPFSTLKQTEDFLQYIKKVDPLCYKEFQYEKAFYNEQDGYDDRAYIRFKI